MARLAALVGVAGAVANMAVGAVRTTVVVGAVMELAGPWLLTLSMTVFAVRVRTTVPLPPPARLNV